VADNKWSWGRLFGRKEPIQAQTSSQSASQEGVPRAFEDLMARYEDLLREQQQQGPSATVSLPQQILAEAEREASQIKIKARREAEVLAAPILADAKRQAQEAISDAQRQAYHMTQQEVENILETARKKAELIEDRAKQVAHLFLVRSREEIQGQLALEAKEAFYKLLGPLNDVLSSAQEIESQWKGRTLEIWQSSSFDLEEYQSELFGSLGPSQLQTPVDMDVDVQQTVTEPPEGPAMDPQGTVEPAVEPQETNADVEGTGPAVAAEEPEQVAVEPEVVSEPTVVEAAPVEGLDPAAAEVASQLEQMDTGDGLQTPAPDLEQYVAAAEITEQTSKPTKTKSQRQRDKAKVDTNSATAPEAYEGEVDLAIEPFANVALISKLYRQLRTVEGLKVLQTTGTWDKGTFITVELEQPLSLSHINGHLSGVEAVSSKAEGGHRWKMGDGSSSRETIYISFDGSTEGPSESAGEPAVASDEGQEEAES
jgi:hypothetical protein